MSLSFFSLTAILRLYLLNWGVAVTYLNKHISSVNALILLTFIMFGKVVYADSVGQAQVTKFFAPETVQMLLNRTGSATPGIQQGDTLTYIIESIPVNDGGNQGVNGYITDYIPKGLEVVAASFVTKVPNPTLPGGFDYVDVPLHSAGLMQQGTGKRNVAFLPPFASGGLPEGTQDTGIFYSTDSRTARTPIGINVTACTGAGFAAPLLVYNQWDIDQFNAFGNGGGCIVLPVGPALTSGGQGTHPLITLGVQLKGLGSPVAGPETYYTNDYNPGLLVPATCIAPIGAIPATLPYACAGPWKRINYPGSMMGGQGPVTAYLAGGLTTAPVSTAVPTSIGEFLSPTGGNPNLPWAATIPATRVNAVRWAFGQRVVGTVERVKISFRVRDFAAFSAAPPLGAGFQNHSSVFGGDITAPAAGKDLTYKYLGPTQSISDARLMLIKQVVAVGVPSLLNPAIINWTPSDGATVSPGQFVKYRITYLNATSRSLVGFSIVDQLDVLPNIISGVVNVAYVAGSATTGVPYLALPVAGAGTVSWTPILPQSTLVPGGGGYVELVVQVLPGAGLGDTTTNTAHALSTLPVLSVFSYAPSNITTVPPARLTNSKSVSPTSAIPGQNVKYHIVVSNTGGPLVGPIFGGAAAGGGSVYPAGGDIVIGDKLDPNLVIAPNTLATPITVSLRDKNTGLVYPYPAAVALPRLLVQPPIPPALVGTPVAYWTITGYPLTYPVPVPLPAATNYLTNVDFIIDFYATVQLPAAPGTYFNGLESYAADIFSGVDLNWATSGLAPLTVSAAGSTLFPNISFKKTATDINGPLLAPSLKPGEDILYNFTITNAVAPSPPATNVVVTDPVPPGTKFIVGSVAGLGATVSYSNNGGLTYLYPPVGLVGVIDPYVTHVRLTYLSLAAGATLSPSFKVRTLSSLQNGSVISNQATLNALSGIAPFSPFSLTSDDNPLLLPNPNPTTINISALSDFTTSTKTVVGNTGGGTNVQPADVLTYTITVTNTGFSASNVSVVDTLDLTKLNFGLYGVLPANWSVIGPDATGVIRWSVANMPAASTAKLTFTATVKALAKGSTVDNAAVISSNQSTPQAVNAPTLTIPAPRVSGVVFSDANGNAIQDVGESGVANVTVALRATGSAVDTVSTVTNASGAYVLTAPLAGDWYAQVTDLSGVLTGFSATTSNPLAVALVDGVNLSNQNFGYKLSTLAASVKGRVFDDVDANGIQNVGEVGYGLVTLELQTATGVVLASTVTDVLGDYVFANVAAGDYRLVITDTSSVLFNRYLTTGLSSPVSLVNLLADSISTVNFGYALGSQIGDVVFDDANNNGIQDIGETGIPGIVLTLTKGGVTVATVTTDNLGAYLFTAIPPSNAPNDYTLSLVVPAGFTASTALTSPALLTVVSGVNDLTKDFGFNALPNLSVTKTVASPTANFSSSAEYTITVTNTGGAAANFSVADILPTATPPLSVGGALPYTASPSSFLYFSTTSVQLNGVPYTAPTSPLVQFVIQPKWSGFTMPAASTLTIKFTAFTGALEGVHHNGVRLSYNNSVGALLPQTVLDFPDLASVTLSTTGVLSKSVTAVNGVAPVAGIEPTVTVGDTVTYTVTLTNSPAAVAQKLTFATETMPVGFSYIPNSTVITAPLNQPVAFNPAALGQVLTWTMPAATPPTTLALNPLSKITLSFNLLVGPTAVKGSQTDVATAGVVVGLNPVLTLSTGNTAPVTLLKPLLSMSKATSTPLITKDALSQYAPASYTVSVLNAGLVNATGVTLTDTLPLGFTFGTGAALINGVPVAASFTQAGQVLTITTNPAGGFIVPANNGVSDGRLTINYTATIAPTNLPNVYTNTVALTSVNANPISGVSAAVELSGIQLSKATSTPNIGPGGVARYTITVTNNGGISLANTTIADILPTGFTYQSGSTLINGVLSPNPAGTLATPQWLIATVAANSNVTISFNAKVDPLITPKIYYNTIQGHNASGQTFPNPGPTAPVTIVPPTPTLMVLKSASTATAAPGAVIIYTVNVVNTGTGQANTVVVTDAMSQYTKLALTPFAPANTTMFSFIDGANPSGLLGTAIISFSKDGGANYNYTPVNDGTGYDPAITNFKLQMNGTMKTNQTANPSFSVQYQVQVK